MELTMTLLERATEQLKPIAKFWSTHYKIKYGNNPDALAYIDFQNIYVNPEYDYLSDVELQALLLHEYGHRFIAPGKLSVNQRKEIITKTFSACGIESKVHTNHFDSKHKVIYLLINIAYDLIVDRFYIKHNHWKSVYEQGFVKINYDLFVKNLNKAQDCLNEQQIHLQSILSGITYFNLISKKSTQKKHRPYRKHCKPFLKIIHNKQLELDDRVSQLVSALFKIFISCSGSHRLETLLIELLKNLYRLNDAQINSISQLNTAPGTDKFTLEAPENTDMPMQINTSLSNEIQGYLLQTYQGTRKFYTKWSLSDQFTKLNLKRSYRKSNILLPGLTTKKDEFSEITQSVIKHQALNVCIMVDDSGSMSGQPALFCRSITQAVNEFLSLIDKPVSLISFGSDINLSMPPSYHYQEITRYVSNLNGSLGGTNLNEPLIMLNQWLENNETINHLLLITDAEVGDWNNLTPLISTLLESIKITILLINAEIPEAFDLLNHRKLSVFKINPEITFDHAILEELVI